MVHRSRGFPITRSIARREGFPRAVSQSFLSGHAGVETRAEKNRGARKNWLDMSTPDDIFEGERKRRNADSDAAVNGSSSTRTGRRVPENPRAPPSFADDSNAASRRIYGGGVGGSLPDPQPDGLGAPTTDATLRIFDESKGGSEGLLPHRREPSGQHSGVYRRPFWLRGSWPIKFFAKHIAMSRRINL